MKPSELKRALASAVQSAQMAGALMRKNFHSPKKVNEEHQHDIKLELDVRCQKLIGNCPQGGNNPNNRQGGQPGRGGTPGTAGPGRGGDGATPLGVPGGAGRTPPPASGRGGDLGVPVTGRGRGM